VIAAFTDYLSSKRQFFAGVEPTMTVQSPLPHVLPTSSDFALFAVTTV